MTPDLLVDLSNVCRDRGLGGGQPATWARYETVLQAWRAQVNAHSSVLAISDDSLLRHLSSVADRAAFVSSQGRGELIAVPDADPVILDLASKSGAAVLSRDGFVGHRRRHDWIQGDAEHFWSWSAGPSGVRIVRRDMAVKGGWTMTRAAEKDERKAKNLLHTDGVPLLSRLWACHNQACGRSLSPLLEDPPLLWHGRPLCPDCRDPATDEGPRQSARELKFSIGDRELQRARLIHGQPLVVGRGPGPGRVDLSALETGNRISRAHASLELRGGQCVVADLGSTNGTELSRWDGRLRRWAVPQPLGSNPVTLLPRDRIRLAGIIWVAQSARDYVVSAA